jgi:hypothetical protein
MDIVKNKAMSNYEEILWQGDVNYVGPNSYLALCDGFLKLFANDPNVITVPGVVLTAANIVAEMTKVYDAIPDVMMNDPELKFYMPINTKKMFRQAIASSPSQVNNLGIGLVGNDDFDFFGIPILFTHGIPANRIVASLRWNLWVAVDLTEDVQNIEVINFSKTTGADKVGLKARFMSGVNIYAGKYVVYYS